MTQFMKAKDKYQVNPSTNHLLKAMDMRTFHKQCKHQNDFSNKGLIFIGNYHQSQYDKISPVFLKKVNKPNNVINRNYRLAHREMNFLASHTIPCCLSLVLLMLLYWIVRLGKFQDYKFAFREYYRMIQRLAAQVQRKFITQRRPNRCLDDTSKITIIDLEKDREIGEVLTNSELNRKFSIKLQSSSNELKRRNSIDYSIQTNSIEEQTQFNQSQIFPGELLLPKIREKSQNISTSASNSQLNLCFPTALHVNSIIPKGKNYLPAERRTKSSVRQSTDYLKMYMQFQRKSKTQLVSMKCAKSIGNLEKRVSFRNLCQINGIKTIQDLIAEGA